jgi:RNA polymerase sigma factor (sigma-70 family)
MMVSPSRQGIIALREQKRAQDHQATPLGQMAPLSMAHSDEHFRELLRRVREGCEDAAWELIDLYADALRRAVRRALDERLRPQFDSLDFVQMVWKSFFRVRHLTARFNSPGALGAYLVKMARNKVGMEFRRRLMTEKYNVNRERSLDAEKALGVLDIRDPGPAPIEVAIAHERWDGLLRSQPARYRQIIALKLQGHTCREIGRSLHLAECTVRRFLNKLLEGAAV